MPGAKNLVKNIMKAVRVNQFGGPEVLKIESNLPKPAPQNKQVLIKVHAAGVNPVDTYIRSGTYAVKPTLPFTPGKDVSGVIEDVGPNVTQFKNGDRVFTLSTDSGGYAEYCTAAEDDTKHLHGNLTFEQGAGMGVPYYTAYRAVKLVGKARPGETVLIHGASGSVGLACVQIACASGLTVLGTAGTQQGIDIVAKNGADFTFNHREEGYLDKIKEATQNNGPDLIIEMLANVNLEKDLHLVAKRGRIVVVGNRGSVEINPRITMQKECVVTGMLLFNMSQSDRREIDAALSAGMKQGWVKPQIAKEYSLEQASQVHEDIINNTGACGRLIIKLR